MTIYPSAKEFLQIVRSGVPSDIVRRYLFEGVPYVFRTNPQAFDVLKKHLASNLRVDPRGITVVGSARTGFSMDPDKYPRQFHAGSDIDVVVVDERLFDQIWTTLLRWYFPRRLSRLGAPDRNWISSRKDAIFWGWLAPDKIGYKGLSFPSELKPMRNLSARWFNAFHGLSQYSEHGELTHREIFGRLYRTWNHAYLYHTDGLRALTAKFGDTEGD
jgi:hypothetical protein